MLFIAMSLAACQDFVEVEPPRTDLIKSTVFADDKTATSAILDIYYPMRSSGFASGTSTGISYLTSLTSDEQISYFSSTPEVTAQVNQFNNNTLVANNTFVLALWNSMYKTIYKANAAIEGLTASTTVTETVRNQLIGEAKFIRAFTHFYLVNLWGDIPLITTTDYRVNAQTARTSIQEIYSHMISDLVDAKAALSSDYSFSKGERVRPNKGAATALLARAYLFNGDFANAEAEASELINNSAQYKLVSDLSTIHTKNNSEVVWQIWSDSFPQDILTFYIFAAPRFGALRPEAVAAFDPNDKRKNFWIGTTGTHWYAKKYSSFTLTEYSTVMRLAEQYLIRAEARVQQNKLSEASTDINAIRARAGLPPTTATTSNELVDAILAERKFELFTEWGHRWLDLKRTNQLEAIMPATKPDWQANAALFPIPEYELLNNLALRGNQNPGY